MLKSTFRSYVVLYVLKNNNGCFPAKTPTALLMEATGHDIKEMFLRYMSTADTDRATELGNCWQCMGMGMLIRCKKQKPSKDGEPVI